MQVDVEFIDEFGDPIVFPDWPRCPHVTNGEGGQRNRLQYSHSYLAQFGHSFSRADTFAYVKKTIHEITPWMQDTLAISLQIVSFKFGGNVLSDTMLLSDSDIKVSKRTGGATVLEGKTLDCIVAVCQVHINVHHPEGKVSRVHFDKFPRDSITCQDVISRLQEKIGPLGNYRLVRTYPGQRMQRFVPEERLFGFPGVLNRGLWEQPPYHGPIYPARLPTPPLMKLELVPAEQVKLLEKEEDWWHILGLQPQWIGELELHSGNKMQIFFKLEVPKVASWFKLSTSHSVTSKNVHSLVTKAATIIDEAGRIVTLTIPDISAVHGPCGFTPVAQVHDVPNADRYLPTSEEIKLEGKEYQAYQPGISFGKGEVIILEPGQTQSSKLPCTFRLHVTHDVENSIIVSAFRPGDKEKPLDDDKGPIEYIYEGKLAKGVSECYYIKGHFNIKKHTIHPSVSPTTLRLPFCVFQMTIGGTVPEVITSPIGKRYSGLSTRSMTIFSSFGNVEHVGRQVDWLPFSDLEKFLKPNTPLVVLGHLLVEEDGGERRSLPLAILWSVDSHEDLNIPAHYLAYLEKGRQVIMAKTLREVEVELAQYTLLGFGNRLSEGEPASANPLDRFRKQHSNDSNMTTSSKGSPTSTPPIKRSATVAMKPEGPHPSPPRTPQRVNSVSKKPPPPTLPKPRVKSMISLEDIPLTGDPSPSNIDTPNKPPAMSGDDLLSSIYHQLQNPTKEEDTSSPLHSSLPGSLDDINNQISDLIKASPTASRTTNRFALGNDKHLKGDPHAASPLRKEVRPNMVDTTKDVSSRTALLDDTGPSPGDSSPQRLSRNLSESSFGIVGSDTSSFDETRRGSFQADGHSLGQDSTSDKKSKGCCTVL